MRKKLILGAIFSLTLITVAVTIIRGTIHTGKVATDGSQTQNIAWAWFWLSIEFIMGKPGEPLLNRKRPLIPSP
jgi:hypothetical protein